MHSCFSSHRFRYQHWHMERDGCLCCFARRAQLLLELKVTAVLLQGVTDLLHLPLIANTVFIQTGDKSKVVGLESLLCCTSFLLPLFGKIYSLKNCLLLIQISTKLKIVGDGLTCQITLLTTIIKTTNSIYRDIF